jgi:hypothetical protein
MKRKETGIGKLMETVPEKIRETITIAKPRLMEISSAIASRKPGPEEWSKKQILGHLIDSALNNHQRFVRGAYNAALQFPPYDQNCWVEVQEYNERNWMDLIDLWAQCNQHLCQMLDRLTDKDLDNLCNIGKESPVTLRFVSEDYLRHLKMHLEQILETSV